MVTLGRVGAVALLAGLLTCIPSVAMAQAQEDSRATQHDGNVVFEPGERDDCPTLWPGSHGVVLVDADPSNEFIDVLVTPPGTDITGVIVKGGDRYNRYEAAALGPLPWLNLYSPLNKGGNIPAVSHWFACGKDSDETPTTPPTTTSEPTTTSPGETTTSPGETTTTSPGETTTTAPVTTTAPGVTTTNVVPVGNPGDDGDLAETGANPGWLLITGLLLLLGGGLALLSPKVRAAFARH